MGSMELSTSVVSEGTPSKTLYVLHGIFGSGRNWSSVIRQLVRKKTDWQAVLVDLRQHGNSQGFPAPHTIEAAANDLETLDASRQPPDAILGHSFGGKVALMYAKQHGAENLKQVWVIDSTPEARAPDGSAWQMLGLIRTVPREFKSRDELVSLLTRFGIATPTAQWMATNLELRDGAYCWRFD
ncbi:MAG TPA: alpha/beta fold hydrolase, partial [Longimicrobiales bacterium]|nr:alpha/beta fold hydrolase [Longimicrobiales bacterium]